MTLLEPRAKCVELVLQVSSPAPPTGTGDPQGTSALTAASLAAAAAAASNIPPNADVAPKDAEASTLTAASSALVPYLPVSPAASPVSVVAAAPGASPTAVLALAASPKSAVGQVTPGPASSASPRKALARFLAGFGEAASMRGKLGHAPPCRSYRLVRTMESFSGVPARILDTLSKDEQAAIGEEQKPFRTALNELITMTKAAKVRLCKGLDEAQKKEADAKEGHKAKASALAQQKRDAKIKAASAGVWDTAATHGEALPTYVATAGASLQDFNYDSPCIIRLPTDTESLGEDGLLTKSMCAFEERFKIDPLRTEPGRAQKKLPEAEADAIFKLITGLFPDSDLLQQMPAAIAEQLKPIKYAVAKGRQTCSVEGGHLTVIRLSGHGTRRLAFAPLLPLLRFHAQLSGMKMQDTPLQKVSHFFKSLPSESLMRFVALGGENKVLYGTVGSFDAVYIPTGWVFAEHVQDKQDLIGLRVVVAPKPTKSSMNAVSDHLQIIKKPNDVLQQIFDAVVKAEED